MGKLIYGRLGSHIVAVVVSLLLHTGVIALLLGKWEAEEPKKRVIPPYIKATLLTLEAKPKPVERPKVDTQAQVAKKRAEQQRLKEQRLKEQRIQEQRRKEQQRRKAEAERKKREQQLAEQRRKQEREERERLQREKAEQERRRQQEFAKALAGEEAELEAATDAQVTAAYSAYIRDRIANNWSRPPSARRDMEVELLIQLLPNGQVASVAIAKSSGNQAFDRSAEDAVAKVERFERLREVPSDVFERNFRRLRLVFSPDDLRL